MGYEYSLIWSEVLVMKNKLFCHFKLVRYCDESYTVYIIYITSLHEVNKRKTLFFW